VVPWANGLGSTAVVAASPSAADWEWRVSIADVTEAGPFSSFRGVDRHIAVVGGAGMLLTVGDGSAVRMTEGSPSFSFPGDVPTSCRLIDGALADLNLMVRRATLRGALRCHHVDPGGPLNLAVDDVAAEAVAVVAAVVIRGAVVVNGEQLGRFDAVVQPTAAERIVVALTPSRVMVATVRPI
jgi:environmental stress-induced protein Ves